MAYDTLHDRLRGPIAKTLHKELGIKNPHALPRLEKVIVNVGINKSKMDSKEMQAYIDESLGRITGQKPVFTKARQSISNFKIREGMVIGAMVTLRGKNMEEFLDRLVSYALPRIRDFRGLNTKLDGHGNYAIGLKDHTVFPEVPPTDAKNIFGLQIQITTTAQNDEEAKVLLKEIGIPFRPSKPVEEAAEEKAEEKAAAPVAQKAEEEPKDAEEPKAEAAEETPVETDDNTSDSSEPSVESDDAAPAAEEEDSKQEDSNS